MANSNPPLDNLTSMGKGRPPIPDRVSVNVRMQTKLRDRLDAIAEKQDWTRSYLIEVILQNRLGLPSDYDDGDLDLILQGFPVE